MAHENSYNAHDADLKKTIALPAAAGAVNSASIDLGGSPFLAPSELEIITAACDSVAAPDTSTLKVDVEESTDDSSFTTIEGADDIIDLTAESGAGFAKTTRRYRLPSDVSQYIRVTATSAVSAADCSDSDLSMELLT